MKRTFFYFSILLFTTVVSTNAETTVLEKQIKQLTSVTNATPLENTAGYAAKFDVRFTQPLDHQNPQKGNFSQRVVVMHRSIDRPTVLVTEGYAASYAMSPSYLEELSRLFNTNVVFVEHRFFDVSTPTPCDWTYMTDRNAMGDLHQIVTSFKQLYPGKWISTGISKGGQTCMQFRALYPNDVDVSVPYVAPLCFGVEDGRHEPFISGYCGSKRERKAVQNFQKDLLINREALQPLLDSLVEAEGLEFNLPTDEIFDYCVLEFSFSFWQWGISVPAIPSRQAPLKEKFDFMVGVAGPDYFEKQSGTTPFFVQAAKELGYYGYELTPFRKWLHIASAEGYMERIFLPQGCSFKFDGSLYEKITEFIRTTDVRMLFIYGQYDPWSSVMPDDPGHDNIRFFIQPGGSHRARINTFDDAAKGQIIDILSGWLYER